MTSFVLKIIALVTMLTDHLGYGIYGKLSWMNYIGRIAFPIFAFQIAQGYIHTKNLKKYFIRLFVFALISQFPYWLFCKTFLGSSDLNIFFTLFAGITCIFFYDKFFIGKNGFKNLRPSDLITKFASILIIAIIVFITDISGANYGYWGVLLILAFYICKDNKILQAVFFISMVALYYLPKIIKLNFYHVSIFLAVFTALAIIPIILYNKKQGKKIRYFLYIFYPVHFLLIYLVFNILF